MSLAVSPPFTGRGSIPTSTSQIDDESFNFDLFGTSEKSGGEVFSNNSSASSEAFRLLPSESGKEEQPHKNVLKGLMTNYLDNLKDKPDGLVFEVIEFAKPIPLDGLSTHPVSQQKYNHAENASIIIREHLLDSPWNQPSLSQLLCI